MGPGSFVMAVSLASTYYMPSVHLHDADRWYSPIPRYILTRLLERPQLLWAVRHLRERPRVLCFGRRRRLGRQGEQGRDLRAGARGDDVHGDCLWRLLQ